MKNSCSNAQEAPADKSKHEDCKREINKKGASSQNKWVLIIGANSDIAKPLARYLAEDGYNLILASRNLEELERLASDLKIRYLREVKVMYFDLLDFKSHQSFYDNLNVNLYGAICIAGYLGDQKRAEKDFSEAKKIIDTNYTGPVSILNIIAENMQIQKDGFIVGVSSVAADRGRAINYIYGSSKAGFTVYLNGLRNRLYKNGVSVITVKPGFVHTKMTSSMKLPKLITACPEKVAKDILKAIKKRKDIIYTPWQWQLIMFLIKSIPEKIFKKLNI